MIRPVNSILLRVQPHRVGWLLLIVLAVLLPFELDRPLLSVGPLVFTNLEILLGLVLFLAATAWSQRRLRQRPFSLPMMKSKWLLMTFALFLILSALIAPVEKGNALKASLRLMSGLGLATAVLILVRTRRERQTVLAALLCGGLMAAAIGLIEIFGGQELAWLNPLRPSVTVTGQFMRLTGPFDYANQATMFIEATLPLLLVTIFLLSQSGKRPVISAFLIAGLALVLLLYLEASFLTLSRTGFTTIGLVGLVMAITPRHRSNRLWLGLSVLVLILFAVNTAGNDIFRLRFASEGENEWYQANWQTPATLTMEAAEVRHVPIRVSNLGALVWRSDGNHPINIGGRWIQETTGLQTSEPRWPFRQPVAPGNSSSISIPLKAPSQPGTYRLIWDVVQEEVTWFGTKSGITAVTEVTVLPSATPIPMNPEGDLGVPAWQYPMPIPPRRTLWLVAWQLFRERPLLGIGLDNYRLTYGSYLNAVKWNQTIHTNNWLLEMLVGVGLLGSLPFIIWFLLSARDGWAELRQPGVDPWQIGILAGLLAFTIHGLLDFFLLFNATGLLFWLLVGLWWQGKRDDAHRI